MSSIRLDFGDHLSGILVDGVDGTPFLGATLYFSAEYGVEVEVPFFPHGGGGQFAQVESWTEDDSLPSRMSFHSNSTVIELHGVTWRRSRINYGGSVASVVRLRVSEAVLGGRGVDISTPLKFRSVRSNLDGLRDWKQVTSISSASTSGADGRCLEMSLTLKAPEPFEWQQGEATMRVLGTWGTSGSVDAVSRQFVIRDEVVLESEFEEPQSFTDHLWEQRKVGNLLRFVFGSPIAFRKHRVNSSAAHVSFVEIISVQTVGERRLAEIPQQKAISPLIRLDELSRGGFAQWGVRYDEWKRFILPAAALLQRTDALIEDVIVSTSMSLEAYGDLSGVSPGEHETYRNGSSLTTATRVYRCLGAARFDLHELSISQAGLSRAIADAYNTTKHPSRGDFLDADRAIVVAEVNLFLIRLLALNVAGFSQGDLSQHEVHRCKQGILGLMEETGLLISDDGKWFIDER